MQILVIPLSIYIITTIAGLVTLKLGSSDRPPVAYRKKRLVFNFSHLIILGIFLYIVSFLSYIYLISKYDLGYIIPLAAAFVYISLFIVSHYIFHESFTLRKGIALLLMLVGILLLGVSG